MLIGQNLNVSMVCIAADYVMKNTISFFHSIYFFLMTMPKVQLLNKQNEQNEIMIPPGHKQYGL